MGGPGKAPRMLQPDGTEAGHVAFSPSGRSLAIDVGGDRVEVIDAAGENNTTIYRVTPGTNAPTEVAAWSADGGWVLFFSRFPGKPGVPLNAAPAEGGAWGNVFEPVLPYGDFLTWCGNRHVLSGGAKRSPSEGNQILISGPPQWRFQTSPLTSRGAGSGPRALRTAGGWLPRPPRIVPRSRRGTGHGRCGCSPSTARAGHGSLGRRGPPTSFPAGP